MERKNCLKDHYVIRLIDRTDLDRCLYVIHKSFETVASEFGLTQKNCPKHTAFMTLSQLELQMEGGWKMFGCYDDEQIIGYMSLSSDESEFELHNLSVMPEYRHSGIGKYIIDFAKDYVRQHGGKVIKIGIIEDNTRLKKWYESLGFMHTGTKKFNHLPFVCGYMEWSEQK